VPRLLAVSPVSHPGGAEVGLLRLLRRLDGWDVTLATPGPGALDDAGFPVERLPLGGLGRGQGGTAVTAWPKARRLARRHDVVYLNGTVCGRLLPALPRRTHTVLHVHDLVDRVPRMWHRADVVLADSQAVADRLGDLDVHVVHCPVELDAPAAAQPPWAAGPGPVVGFAGRIEPRKAPLDLVRAAPAIKAAVPGARVILVGDDTFATDAGYGGLVSASMDVERCGWVDDAASLMSHLDVLVLPSYEEPFGTVLAEAMAAGTPVVATTVGGLPEVVTHGVDGVLVPPGRPDALADGVLRVLADRDRMGAAARESAKRFDADRYTERVATFLR
jgi:glycosyltransferase involved in cell wall biosynthesis